MRWGINMAGLKFGTFSQAARVSNLDIDADLDMGVRWVIAAKGRFNEIDVDTMVKMVDGEMKFVAPARFTDRVIVPYTVTPSDNVYFTANNIDRNWFDTSFRMFSGSIIIGPTIVPISPRLLIDTENVQTYRSIQIRVYKNGEIIAVTDEYKESGTIRIDLSDLVEGDVLTFAGRTNSSGDYITVTNFRLAGDVVKHVIDGPTAEDG